MPNDLTSPQAASMSQAMEALVSEGGGGTWPPSVADHLTWPSALQPYHHLFQEISTEIPVLVSSLDDEENRTRINNMRVRIQALLTVRLDLGQVQAALNGTDEWFAGTSREAQRAWFGFCSCVSHLRHAYRWGVSPIVRVAQSELSIIFPDGLDVPWVFIQRRFGTTSSGGNLTSNVYFNTIQYGVLVYSITAGLPEVYRTTEFWNIALFLEMERLALPMYQAICLAASALEGGEISLSTEHLRTVNEQLKKVFRFFYDNLHDHNVSHELWMAYSQGFHGWAYQGIDGVSGGHALVIRSLDALLSIIPWPSPDVEALHLPSAQTGWLNALREYNIRAKVGSLGDPLLVREIDHLVMQLKVWRMTHMRRMVPYEGVPRPERLHMTSGKSLADQVLVTDEEKMVQHLRDLLSKRLRETK